MKSYRIPKKDLKTVGIILRVNIYLLISYLLVKEAKKSAKKVVYHIYSTE